VHHVAPNDAEAIIVEPANPHGVPFPFVSLFYR